MGKEIIPDLTNYSSEELLDIYINLDKSSNPEFAKVLEEKIKQKIDSTSPADNFILRFLKRRKIILLIVVLIAAYFFIVRSYFSRPGETPSSGDVILSVFIHSFIFILLGYFASKGKIIAAILIVLYFLIIMFGRFIF